MSITVENMAANTSKITITVGGDSALVEYSPALVTEEVFTKLMALYSLQAIADKVTSEQEIMGKFGKAFRDLNETIVFLVREWKVYATNEDERLGRAYPLDADLLPRLPLVIRTTTIYSIMADIRPESLAPRETSLALIQKS